jgi:hypothetical protein
MRSYFGHDEIFDAALFQADQILLKSRTQGGESDLLGSNWHKAMNQSKVMVDSYLAATERASSYMDDDSFDEALFASDGVILSDTYKEVIAEKREDRADASLL